MAQAKKTNGHVPAQKASQASEFARLIKRGFSRQSIDHFAHDFCLAHEAAVRDVVDGHMTMAMLNSVRGAYGNELRMIDTQLRARKLGVTSSKAKLLNP